MIKEKMANEFKNKKIKNLETKKEYLVIDTYVRIKGSYEDVDTTYNFVCKEIGKNKISVITLDDNIEVIE